MASKRASRSCAFCGTTTNLTTEHAIPRWISKLLAPKGPITHQHVSGKPWESRAFEMTTNRVCGPCNHGWMSHLETNAQPILTPMLRSETRIVHRRSERRTLAAWVYKTALVWQLTLPKPNPCLDAHYRYLGTHGEPPATVQVSVGRFQLSDHIRHPERTELRRGVAYKSVSLDMRSHDDTAFRGYAAAFHIAYFAAHVFGHEDGFGLHRMAFAARPPHRAGDMLIPAWPLTAASVYWPPKVSWEDASLDMLLTGLR